jgi:chromosome partitioning protein
MPRVVSVLNYKGGVGKTTLTANIGAELANRGHKVLLLDLDPQSSLTFSFYRPADWESELEDKRTVLQWFGECLHAGKAAPLRPYVVTPPEVNAALGGEGGRLDLVAGHLGLIDVDLDLAADLGGTRGQVTSPMFLPVYRVLADALADGAFDEYDDILIDCAPNFAMVTRTAVVASDHVLVPAKPDYLSTLGIDFLRGRLSELVSDYNKVAGAAGVAPINPVILGVVFTMIQYGQDGPIAALRNYIAYVERIEFPVFSQMIRENKSIFGTAGEASLPAILTAGNNNTLNQVKYELQQLALEYLARTRN